MVIESEIVDLGLDRLVIEEIYDSAKPCARYLTRPGSKMAVSPNSLPKIPESGTPAQSRRWQYLSRSQRSRSNLDRRLRRRPGLCKNRTCLRHRVCGRICR